MGSTRFILVASLFILYFTCATSYGQSYLEVREIFPFRRIPKTILLSRNPLLGYWIR